MLQLYVELSAGDGSAPLKRSIKKNPVEVLLVSLSFQKE